MTDRGVTILYRNWQGAVAYRRVLPLSWEHRASEYHAEPQYLVLAWDYDKRAFRRFAMRDVLCWDCEPR